MPILNVHTGSLPSFALRMKQDDTLKSIRSRCAKKINLSLEDGIPLVLWYRWQQQLYTLEDDDDWEIFADRFSSSHEADLYLESPEIPSAGSHADAPIEDGRIGSVQNESTPVARTADRGAKGTAVSTHRAPPNPVASLEEHTEAGGVTGGGRDSILYPPPREAAPAPGWSKPVVPEAPLRNAAEDAMSLRSRKTMQTQQTATPRHKIAFQEFHSQLGVRLLRGSIGPVSDVPMMLKEGYRHVYVSRSFALAHGFIPKDTRPGSYGFNGITNLGKWPVQIGSKAVSCVIYLAEDSYFPVILGRSFQEKRGVKTDPIDPASIQFLDNNEYADVEIVVVRDEHGQPVVIP
ncbi:hypothetical protein K437DRAFT_253048 [Tilletiaria anomala UBC 951]|uniref:Uncharacterized protein n=1 Tax=Tilletiaria anomala (strain ATCC 24038 / CBS 436.72 / UBC 951) TaxID=1037660 RepID=A0A066WHV1_TILAU|nr:uncharacterized protein K437DRAFT_253048 [Tilletiaria anomala UBC 951]KDN53356.1 hypothetical protein K437DRAFT_253048 [Tilletiaria anomala UBC 951]